MITLTPMGVYRTELKDVEAIYYAVDEDGNEYYGLVDWILDDYDEDYDFVNQLSMKSTD